MADKEQLISLSVRFTIDHPSSEAILKAHGELIIWLDTLLNEGFTVVRNSTEYESRIQHPRIETHKWVKISDAVMSKDVSAPILKD